MNCTWNPTVHTGIVYIFLCLTWNTCWFPGPTTWYTFWFPGIQVRYLGLMNWNTGGSMNSMYGILLSTHAQDTRLFSLYSVPSI